MVEAGQTKGMRRRRERANSERGAPLRRRRRRRRGARHEGLEETEIATKTKLACSGGANEREQRRRGRGEEKHHGRGWEREEKAREAVTSRRRSTTERERVAEIACARRRRREPPARTRDREGIARLAKAAGVAAALYLTGARMRERHEASRRDRVARRDEGKRVGGRDAWDARACWVDGCWYGFQEEREGEG